MQGGMGLDELRDIIRLMAQGKKGQCMATA